MKTIKVEFRCAFACETVKVVIDNNENETEAIDRQFYDWLMGSTDASWWRIDND
jgi:hypothetical protein